MSFCFQMQAMAIVIYMQYETFQTGKKKEDAGERSTQILFYIQF